MNNNSTFRKDIIQKSAELTSKNLDMVRLNNVTLTREMKKKKATESITKKKINYDNLKQLEKKYKQEAEDPLSRKLFIKQIGRSNPR